ncbi:ankyrin repeat and SOCS box protein 2-like [Salvelinus namaycush]|uniref:Ankyrin repeat and SOCS box protein 2-like n=1 Tax=Salvelinus namaycush TaxID=8040 RepID=A0A8U0PFW5_SALNM|nr:ankyrin repeat and SOCS box protein 2-like [Salvelinus namaycush]
MAVASMSMPGRMGTPRDLDDYSHYSALSDEELMQLAIERSLTEDHTSINAIQSSPPVNVRPLVPVIENGDLKALKEIVKCNPKSLFVPNEDGWISLHEAAYYGQEECLKIILRAHPGIVNTCGTCNQTPLLLAAIFHHVNCVECLLDRGANPNIANNDGETPLLKACGKPNAEIVDHLLKYGASVHKACVQGVTPLHEAAGHDNVEICQMLLDAGAKLNTANIYGIDPFFMAAQNGRVEVLSFLISKGVDMNCQACDGATPLYEASKNGHKEVVELLLSQKADANRTTKSGLVPLHVAVQKGHFDIVSMLIPATSKAKVQCSGISPLHLAAEHNRDWILEVLIKGGYDVNLQLAEDRSKMYEDRRSTALYFAVANNNLEAAEMLLEAGANPNLDMFNPLLIAVRRGCMEMITMLVEHGANMNASILTHPCSFPAVVMLGMKYSQILKYLMDNGCDALSCFDCTYDSKPHPPLKTLSRGRGFAEMLHYATDEDEAPINMCIQFCETINDPTISCWAGPIIDTLLDYVGHVKLCSRLIEHLDSNHDWAGIKVKAIESPVVALQPNIPEVYQDLREVLSKTTATGLPLHRRWDCAINP